MRTVRLGRNEDLGAYDYCFVHGLHTDAELLHDSVPDDHWNVEVHNPHNNGN